MAISRNVDTITFNDSTTQAEAFCTACLNRFCNNPVKINYGNSTVSALTASAAVSSQAATSQFYNLTATTSFYRQGTGGTACVSIDVSSSPKRTYCSTCIFQRNNFVPSTNNTKTLGTTALRWSALWVSGGSYTTVSDENLKTDITPISEQEKAVAIELQKNLKRFKFKDAVAKKGFDGARYHLGCIAQEVEQMFRDKGLDPFKYGMIGFDTWYERIDPETQELDVVYVPTDGYTKKEMYSIRYCELISFIMAAI